MDSIVFSYSIEDDDGIVDTVSHDGEDGSDEDEVYLSRWVDCSE
jgi:hypothetical protein